MTKLLYKPIGIICGLIAGRLATRLFAAIWTWIDSREPPRPSEEDARLAKLVGAAVIEAAIFQGTRVAFDRAGRRWFYNLTALWPGRAREETEERRTRV